jgi:hypothetical protein
MRGGINMPAEKRVKFIVRRRFKYGKHWFMPGEEFKPAGGKFDDAILMSNLVYRDTGDFRHPNRVSARRHTKRMMRLGTKAAARIKKEQAITPKKATVPKKTTAPKKTTVRKKEVTNANS